jgi:hypothetical protein
MAMNVTPVETTNPVESRPGPSPDTVSPTTIGNEGSRDANQRELQLKTAFTTLLDGNNAVSVTFNNKELKIAESVDGGYMVTQAITKGGKPLIHFFSESGSYLGSSESQSKENLHVNSNYGLIAGSMALQGLDLLKTDEENVKITSIQVSEIGPLSIAPPPAPPSTAPAYSAPTPSLFDTSNNPQEVNEVVNATLNDLKRLSTWSDDYLAKLRANENSLPQITVPEQNEILQRINRLSTQRAELARVLPPEDQEAIFSNWDKLFSQVDSVRKLLEEHGEEISDGYSGLGAGQFNKTAQGYISEMNKLLKPLIAGLEAV